MRASCVNIAVEVIATKPPCLVPRCFGILLRGRCGSLSLQVAGVRSTGDFGAEPESGECAQQDCSLHGSLWQLEQIRKQWRGRESVITCRCCMENEPLANCVGAFAAIIEDGSSFANCVGAFAAIIEDGSSFPERWKGPTKDEISQPWRNWRARLYEEMKQMQNRKTLPN